MTEAQLTRTFLKLFKSKHPEAVVFKINDRTTSGIPDAAITLTGHTLWIEFKRDKPALTPLQTTTLTRLARASGGRSLVVVFKAGRTVDIYDGYVTDGAPRPIASDLLWDAACIELFATASFGSHTN